MTESEGRVLPSTLHRKIDSNASTRSVFDPEELVVIEINFGKGRKDDITVHYGDDPHKLAEVLDVVTIIELLHYSFRFRPSSKSTV
jgi:hypothetical protein